MHSSLEVSDADIQMNPERAGYYLQCTNSGGDWKDLYFFHMKECFEKDFEIYNWWCATAPQAAMKNMTIADFRLSMAGSLMMARLSRSLSVLQQEPRWLRL